MASSMISSVAPVTRATTAQASMVAHFTGLKSIASFPVTRKLDNDITSVASNGGRVQCMKVWPPINLKKFETLSYLSPLSKESLAKEVDYLLRIWNSSRSMALCTVSTKRIPWILHRLVTEIIR